MKGDAYNTGSDNCRTKKSSLQESRRKGRLEKINTDNGQVCNRYATIKSIRCKSRGWVDHWASLTGTVYSNVRVYAHSENAVLTVICFHRRLEIFTKKGSRCSLPWKGSLIGLSGMGWVSVHVRSVTMHHTWKYLEKVNYIYDTRFSSCRIW